MARQGMDRRRLVRVVGAAGFAGAFGLLGGAPVFAQQDGATDFATPAILKSGAQLDSRFPVSFAEPQSHSFRLITEYFTDK